MSRMQVFSLTNMNYIYKSIKETEKQQTNQRTTENFGQTKPPADQRSSVSGVRPARQPSVKTTSQEQSCLPVTATMASGQNEMLSKAEDIADKVSLSMMSSEGMMGDDQISTI